MYINPVYDLSLILMLILIRFPLKNDFPSIMVIEYYPYTKFNDNLLDKSCIIRSIKVFYNCSLDKSDEKSNYLMPTNVYFWEYV